MNEFENNNFDENNIQGKNINPFEYENNSSVEKPNTFEYENNVPTEKSGQPEYQNNDIIYSRETSSQDYGYRVYNSQYSNTQNVSTSDNLNITTEQMGNDQHTLNDAQSSIQIVTMNNKKKKNKKFVRRAAIACATIAVFGCSVGLGVVMGTKTSENSLNNSADYSDFKFEELPEAAQMSISDNNEIIGIVKNVSNSVVNISIKAQQTDFFNQIYENTGSGSGIIYKEDNEKIYIITNNHVIDGATSVNISITGTEQIAAKLVGKDATSDVAVISVLKSDLAAANITNIKVAEFADSEQVEVGEYVLAIGNALGQGKTVTQGIISAQNKQVNIDGRKLNVLQTDAAINPGNSGGALVNSTGKIIGMNTAKLSGTTVEGTGYALPSSSVKSIAEELITNGTVSKPYLGIIGFTMSNDFISMYNLNTTGVFIKGVEENSAAKAAGLKYSDIITSINGTKISTMEELSAIIGKCKVGDTINIDIIRNGYQPMSVKATLADMNSKF